MPAWMFSPNICDTSPTKAGPIEPPRSPARARNANSAVPPVGSLDEEILMEPGYMMPTEKPHIMHAIRPKIGIFASAASR
jgi:hypothetical protein